MHPSGQVSAAPQQRQGQGHCRRGRGVPADAKLDGPLPGEDNIPPGLSPPAEETVLRRSAAAEIRDLILHMRQPYQPVCRLCLLEEKTPEEAALALGRPVKTIHTQLSRGKRMLREALERSGNDDMLSP